MSDDLRDQIDAIVVEGICPRCGAALRKVQNERHDKEADQLDAWGCDGETPHLFVPGRVTMR